MDIPQTPKPKCIDDIQEQARDRFAGIIICDKNDDISIDNYFSEYDYYEKYDENKSYSKRTYQSAYKGVLREYQNYLYVLESDYDKQYYVVAKKLYNDLEILEKHCPCLKCSASYLNPLKYIWCPYCTNCIKAGKGFAKDEYIKQAQELKDKSLKYPSNKLEKYVKSNNVLKISEIVIFIMFLVLFSR